MALSDDLERIARAASNFAEPGESLSGVLAAEPESGVRTYLCAFAADGRRSWLALDEAEQPVTNRNLVRQAVSIAAMCELAGETAAGGDLEELRSQLVSLRLTENPPGIEEAEDAALALERAIGAPPRLATPAYLDEVGAATRRLEQALGDQSGSPFTAAMGSAVRSVEVLAREVEDTYKLALH